VAIKVASWNVEGRLSGYQEAGRGSASHILDGIESLDSDVIILPEAYLEEVAPGVDERLKELGYEWQDIEYGKNERDWSKEYLGKVPSLRVMSRLAIADVQANNWGDLRPMLALTVRDPETDNDVRLFATHLDDRNEEMRERQADDAVTDIRQTEIPKVMIGDFNAMWHEGRARLIGSRAMRFVARHIPHEGLRHTVTRLADMATGRVLRKITGETGLRDADPSRKGTMTPKRRESLSMPSVRVVQIDHALVSDEVEVGSFAVSRDLGSDHRAISMVIKVNDN
jgi:endonuclease/exonuclease/phosphatase family metal-dependent hydrolase